VHVLILLAKRVWYPYRDFKGRYWIKSKKKLKIAISYYDNTNIHDCRCYWRSAKHNLGGEAMCSKTIGSATVVLDENEELEDIVV